MQEFFGWFDYQTISKLDEAKKQFEEAVSKQVKKKSGEHFTQQEVEQLVDDSQLKVMLESEN